METFHSIPLNGSKKASLKRMISLLPKPFQMKETFCGTPSVGGFCWKSFIRGSRPSWNNLISPGCNGLPISPGNVMVLICKTGNGLESDFLETTSLLDVRQRWRADEELLEWLNTVFTHCISCPFLFHNFQEKIKGIFPHRTPPWYVTFVRIPTKGASLKWFLRVCSRSVQWRILNWRSCVPRSTFQNIWVCPFIW